MKIIDNALTELFQTEEYADCYLVEVKASATGSRLQIFIDSDSYLDLKKCTRISRFLETIIEENNLMPEKYHLEVSSPGIDRPLTLPRQYQKNIDRKIVVELNDNSKHKGRLKTVSDEGISIAIPLSKKEAKKLGVDEKIEEIKYSDIMKAKIQISF